MNNFSTSLKLGIIIALAFAISACTNRMQSSDQIRYVPDNLYELMTSYNREDNSFDLTFRSLAKEDICISDYSWPSEKGGHYFDKYSPVYLIYKGEKHYILREEELKCTPYKRDKCYQKVRTK